MAVWLWFTVLFANFAEAVAEGRGKAQADTLRASRCETMARRLRADGATEEVSSAQLDVGQRVVCEAGDIIPSDGTVVEGIASVDESAITGSLPRLSGNRAGIVRRSPAEPGCCRTASWSRSPLGPGRHSSTG